MKTQVFVASLLALAVIAPAANAMTVQNLDTAAYKVMLTPTGGKPFLDAVIVRQP